MIKTESVLLHTFSLALLCAVLSACTSAGRAPVEDRSVNVMAQPAPLPGAAAVVAPTVARPGHHLVKRGETLYSIALEYGQDYREVAAWNGIENPAVISVGQELRIIPPEGATVSRPLTVDTGIEVRPLDSRPLPPLGQSAPVASPSVPVPASAIKSEPKGGRVAYTPQALENLQKGIGPEQKPSEAKPTEVKPAEVKPAEVKPPVDTKPAVALEGDDVAWMWPAKGNVLATFNEATNKGVDIAGTLGEPVLAAGPGRVVYVGNGLRGYGNLVIIKHNNTYLSAYAHNSQIAVKEGQSVQKGQKIAELGNTDADRPKLHFEIRRQGKPVDPLKYLPAR